MDGEPLFLLLGMIASFSLIFAVVSERKEREERQGGNNTPIDDPDREASERASMVHPKRVSPRCAGSA